MVIATQKRASSNRKKSKDVTDFVERDSELIESKKRTLGKKAFKDEKEAIEYESMKYKNEPIKRCIKTIIKFLNNISENQKILFILLIVTIIIAMYAIITRNVRVNFQSELLKIREEYPDVDKTTYEHIKISFNSAVTNERLSVLLFLYVNESFASIFVRRIGEISAQNLGGNLLVLHKDDYNHPEPGSILEKYRYALEKSRVFLIENIGNLSVGSARDLHHFCDEYSPAVPYSIIYLTLHVNSLSGNELHIAENALNTDWKHIDIDILSALITRVTDAVAKLS